MAAEKLTAAETAALQAVELKNAMVTAHEAAVKAAEAASTELEAGALVAVPPEGLANSTGMVFAAAPAQDVEISVEAAASIAADGLARLAKFTLNKVKITRCGGIGVLRSLAVNGEAEVTRDKGANALGHLFNGITRLTFTGEDAALFADLGGIAVLVEHAIDSPRLAARGIECCGKHAAAEILGYLANKPLAAESFVTGYAVDLLVHLSKAQTESLVDCAVEALGSLALRATTAQAIVAKGGIDALLRLATTGTALQMEKAAIAFENLSIHEEHSNAIAHSGAMRALVRLSTMGSAAQREAAGAAVAMTSGVLAQNRKEARSALTTSPLTPTVAQMQL